MTIIGWLLLCLTIITVTVVVLLVARQYKPYKPPAPDPRLFSQQYVPTNPWSTANPVAGVDGGCNLYTFASTDRFTPASIGFTSINACNNISGAGCVGSGCFCSPPQAGQTCNDDDQIFAQKVQHTCQTINTGWDLRTTGTCRQQNGVLVAPGTTETLFALCTPQGGVPDSATSVSTAQEAQTSRASQNDNRCAGTLALVAFDVNITAVGPTALDSALCMQEPQYVISTDSNGNIVVTNIAPFTAQRCDMTVTYLGFPSQLFRIQRASFDGANFVPDQNGLFARITHRPTGYGVAPALLNSSSGQPSLSNPVVGQPIQLIPLTTGGSTGYWWALIPQLDDPAYVSGALVHNIGRAQMVYVPDATLLPTNRSAIWTYLTTSSTALSVIPESNIAGARLITTQYITVDANAPISGGIDPQARSKLASVLYLDYPIISLITQNLSSFGV
jgi:hypothetical protein